MKRFSFLPILLSGLFASLFSFPAYGQFADKCWDFEESCATPADAFHSGCITLAQSASGTPDTYSNQAGISAFSGSKYAHMYANYCFESGNPNHYHCEGIILKHNFLAGIPVKISFAVRSKGTAMPSETKVILVNSMPNYGGFSGNPGCGNTMDILPAIPANSETVATYYSAAISGTAWEVKTIEWTPQADYNQIWFRPRAISPVQFGELSEDLFLDNVCIETLCPPAPTISLCRDQASGDVVVSINGYFNKKDWQLHPLKECQGIDDPVDISWLPNAQALTLPYHSGCYMLIGSSPKLKGCPLVEYPFIINTDESIPPCAAACSDWDMSIEGGCSIEFTVTPETEFAEPVTFDFEFDGEIIQSGNSNFMIVGGQDGVFIDVPKNDWYEMCVTVHQADCPAEKKCYPFYYDCFRLGSDGSERTDKNQVKQAHTTISNPSSGEIIFSGPVKCGTARLYSMQGSLVKTFDLKETDRLEVKELAAGLYILVIQSEEFSMTSRVFLMH